MHSFPNNNNKATSILGLAEGEWKLRYYNQTQSLENDTARFSYSWEFKKKTS